MTDNSSSAPASQTQVQHPRFEKVLLVLLGMIITLMALGAGVRTMGAGLSCPDWPLCFGQVIPDFHVGVYFEFIHRAYAGLVALVFVGCLWYVLREVKAGRMVRSARVAAWTGFVVLMAQILMGGLTVLLVVKSIVVTSHLMLATIFIASVWCLFHVVRRQRRPANAPRSLAKEIAGRAAAAAFWGKWAAIALSSAILAQIFLGGLVASTYSGMVCVDWPLCNGQWVPTLSGAIGLQIIHRFVAYALVVAVLGFSIWLAIASRDAIAGFSLSPRLARLSVLFGALIVAQLVVGVLNLIWYIPAHLTVLHQSLAVLLLAVSLRIWWSLADVQVAIELAERAVLSATGPARGSVTQDMMTSVDATAAPASRPADYRETEITV